jgi:hypothetical protein
VARRIAAVTPAGTVQSCGSHLDGGFQTTSATFALVRECVITATEAGVALVYASSSVGLASGGAAYEARFALAHISSTGDAATDRWVNVATDSGDGRDRVIVVSRLYRPQSARGRE